MTTATADNAAPPRRKSLAPDLLEKIIAAGALLMLAAMLVALAQGYANWPRIPTLVWLHLATIGTALALTPVLMLKRRGTRLHRRLGWAWSIAMFSTAALSFGLFSDGHWSWIHILSAITVVAVPGLILSARGHRVERHRRTVRTLCVGALLIAGVFTLIPTRMLGYFLFG